MANKASSHNQITDYDKDALDQVRHTRLLIDAYDAWLLDIITPHLGQHVLEVGCGLGNMLAHLTDRQEVCGIEIDATTVTKTQDRFREHHNVSVLCHDITLPGILSLGTGRFDTALSLNVLEHIEDDQLALEHIVSLLQPGGKLVLLLPAHMGLYGSMDRSIGHYRRYSMATVRKLIENAGMAAIEQRYVNALGALGWWLNGRLLRKRVPPTGQLVLLNRIMPVVRAIESRVRPPFGITLLTIAQKPI